MKKKASKDNIKRQKLIPIEVEFNLDTAKLDDDRITQLRSHIFTGELTRILAQIINSVTSTEPGPNGVYDQNTTQTAQRGSFLEESGPTFVEHIGPSHVEDIGPWPDVIWGKWCKYAAIENLTQKYHLRRPSNEKVAKEAEKPD